MVFDWSLGKFCRQSIRYLKARSEHRERERDYCDSDTKNYELYIPLNMNNDVHYIIVMLHAWDKTFFFLSFLLVHIERGEDMSMSINIVEEEASKRGVIGKGQRMQLSTKK